MAAFQSDGTRPAGDFALRQRRAAGARTVWQRNDGFASLLVVRVFGGGNPDAIFQCAAESYDLVAPRLPVLTRALPSLDQTLINYLMQRSFVHNRKGAVRRARKMDRSRAAGTV